MKIFRKITIFLFIFYLFSSSFALAGVEISEIMYDLKTGSDDGREWVEVYNNSEEIIDFSTFKFFEADVNHKLILVQGNSKIEAEGYAIIVSNFTKFKTDWPNFPGNIFDSTFSLNNHGEFLAIKSEDKIVDEYFYNSSLGGAGDGKSLQKINGVWTSSTPTPGGQNKISYTPPPVLTTNTTIKTKNTIVSNEKQIVQENSTFENLSPAPQLIDLENFSEDTDNSYVFILIFIVFLSFSVGAVYFIRKKNKITQNDDDFELLE